MMIRATLFLLLALPLAARADGGTVTGTVEAMPSKFLEETVVYLRDAPAGHGGKTAQMDQKGLRFSPHVLAITAGDSVHFSNHDTVAHNIFSIDQGGYNLGSFGPAEVRDRTFDKPGAYVQLCALHPEMKGYIYVCPTPYYAVVDRDGHFTLQNVPPGTYHLVAWNPQLKAPEQTVTVAAGKAAEAHISLHR